MPMLGREFNPLSYGKIDKKAKKTTFPLISEKVTKLQTRQVMRWKAEIASFANHTLPVL